MFIHEIAALAATSVILASCSTTPDGLPPLEESAAGAIDSVGIITIGPSIGGELDGPVGVGEQIYLGVLEGGAIGTLTGAAGGAVGGLFCGPAMVLCVPAFAIVGGAMGLVGGAAGGGIAAGQAAIPDETAAEIEAALARAIAARELQSELRRRVLQHVSSANTGLDLGVGGTEPLESPDYASFGNQGTDAVLEIGLTQLGFAGEGGEDPALALVLTARARLVRVPDNDILWNVEQVTYVSAEAAYSLWTDEGANLMQSEIDNGLEAMAGEIGEALFVAPAT